MRHVICSKHHNQSLSHYTKYRNTTFHLNVTVLNRMYYLRIPSCKNILNIMFIPFHMDGFH